MDNIKRIEGAIFCNTENSNLAKVNEFKDAFRSIVEKFISSTPVTVLDISFDDKVENELVIIYAFKDMTISYESENSKVSSTLNDAEFGRAMFEFYAKITAETVDPGNIKINSKYVDLTFFSSKNMNKKSI